MKIIDSKLKEVQTDEKKDNQRRDTRKNKGSK